MTMRAALFAAALAVAAAPSSAAVAVNGSASAISALGASVSSSLALNHRVSKQGPVADVAHPVAGAVAASQSLRRLAGAMVGDLDGMPTGFSGLRLIGADQGLSGLGVGPVLAGANAPVIDAPWLPDIMLAASNPALIASHAAVPADAMPSGAGQMKASDLGTFNLMGLAPLSNLSEPGIWGLMLLGFATLGVALRRTSHRSHISFS